jgi:hypothetical protein
MFYWLLLGCAVGLALWAKYFVVVLALPLALFLLLDHDARKSLLTPGPWAALAVALIVMAPHLVWLVQNGFLPFTYATARAAPARGLLDHVVNPIVFVLSQLAFLVPALVIAVALFWPWKSGQRAGSADAFDRRIVTLLAFGPAATVFSLSLLSGRSTIAMWGYPLWLFLGLWLVLQAHGSIEAVRLARIGALWLAIFLVFAVAFVLNYSLLPRLDHRYRAVFYPGERLADDLARRFRAATGHPLAYVIGSMWDGGNVGHYAQARPRVLIDGDPRRAPWIDLGDLRTKGAVVVWTGDPKIIPIKLRGVAGEAQVQPPLTLPFRHGRGTLTVGWAILRPQPAFAHAG